MPSSSLDTFGNPVSQSGLSPVPSPTTPSPISVSGLNSNENPTPIQQPTYPPLYPTAGLTGSTGTDPYANTKPQNQAQDLNSSIQSLNEELSGKSAFETSQFKNLGYGATTDASGNLVANDPSMLDLNSKLTALTNEAKAIPLQLQNDASGRGTTTGGLAPIESGALRNNAVQALGVSSLIAAKQGQLAYATQLVENASQQKYGPIEAELKAKTANLQLIINSPDYTNAQKAQATAQAQDIAQKTAQLDLAKTNYNAVQTEVLKYAGVADAATLSEMQKAQTPAQVAMIAAKAGIQQPQSGRYVDQTTTVKNLDGTTSIVRRIFDSVTGQFVNAPAGTTASTLNTNDGSSGGSTPTYSGVAGATGSPAIDVTSPGYSTTPVAGGLTQAAIDQKALGYLTSGTQPSQGRTGLAGQQSAAIANRMAEMDPGGNLATHKAELKSYSESLAVQQKYFDNTQRAFNTANDTLDALNKYMVDNNVNPSQFPDFNSFSNYLKSKGVDPGTAGGYNAQITTLRQEYSQVLAKGGVRSVETDREAAQLIPSGLAPKDLAKVAAQIQIDSNNVITDSQKQITDIQGKINNIIKPPSATPTKTSAAPSEGDTHDYNGTTYVVKNGVWTPK